MRLRRFTFAFPLSALAGFVIAGCPDDKSLLHPDISTDGGDATVEDGGGDSGPGSGALIRFAHLAPGAPAVDVCVAIVTEASDAGSDDAGDAGDAGPTGPTFTGPILRTPIVGLSNGLNYSEVTQYIDASKVFSIPDEGLKVIARIVKGDATDCNTKLADITDLPPIKIGDQVTVAAVGSPFVPSSFTAAVFRDHATSDAGKAGVRFVNAALPTDGMVDFGFGSGASFDAKAQNVAFGATLANDTDGYVQFDALTDQVVSGRASGAAPVQRFVNSFTADADSLTTIFAIGGLPPSTTSPVHPAVPYAGLVCKDSAPAVGGLSDCSTTAPPPSDAGTDAGKDAGGDAGRDAGDAGDAAP